MMISALKELVHLFFAFDHDNYARWIPLFIQDFEILPKRVRQNSKWDAWLLTEVKLSSFFLFTYCNAQEQMNKKRSVGEPLVSRKVLKS